VDRHDVRSSYEQIQQAIDAACERVGRSRDTVQLVGASKRQPIERLRDAWNAGLRVFGENRVQELVTKRPEMPSEVEWHLIGPLQTNKAKRAVEHATTIQSIDRIKVARAIERHAGELGKPIIGFLEVNIGAEPSKHGFEPETLLESAAPLIDYEHLRIAGLMTIPPYEQDEERAREWFRRLRELRDRFFEQPRWSDREGYLSMGMSHDFTIAIEEGATHVRVGTALFGVRDTPPPS